MPHVSLASAPQFLHWPAHVFTSQPSTSALSSPALCPICACSLRAKCFCIHPACIQIKACAVPCYLHAHLCLSVLDTAICQARSQPICMLIMQHNENKLSGVFLPKFQMRCKDLIQAQPSQPNKYQSAQQCLLPHPCPFHSSAWFPSFIQHLAGPHRHL